MPPEEARRQFDVKYVRPRPPHPTCTANDAGAAFRRIVNVSLHRSKVRRSFWLLVSTLTKFAVEGLSDSLRMELHPFGIDVVIIQPGATHSEWSRIAHESLLKYSGNGAPIVRGACSHAKMMELGHKGSIPAPPGIVAKTIVQAVQAKRPKTRYVTGGLARTMLFMRRVLSDRAFDAMFQMIEHQMTKSKA